MRQLLRGTTNGPEPAEPAPLVAYMQRAVGLGVHISILTLLALVIFYAAPGRGAIDGRVFLTLLGVAAMSIAGVAMLPWPSLLVRSLGSWCLYIWAVGNILLISAGVAVSGGSHSDVYLLYGVLVLFMAATFPPRAQAAMLLFTVLCYVGVLGLLHDEPGLATLFLRVFALALTADTASFLARHLMNQMTAHQAATLAADRRSRVLVDVTAAARAMSTLDPQQLLGTVVGAVVAQGFAAAAVCRMPLDGGEISVAEFRAGAGTGLDAAMLAPAALLDRVQRSGVSALVATPEDLAVVAPHRSRELASLLAAPIVAQGRLESVLVGAHVGRPARPEDIEAFELLAAQTGRALETIAFADGLRRSEERFRALVQHAADVVLVTEEGGAIRYASPAIASVIGQTPAAVMGRNAFELMHPDDRAGAQEGFGALAQRPGGSHRMELRTRHTDGSWRWVDVTVTNLLHELGVEGFVANLHDVTERMVFHEQLRHQAFHDALTGLPNRAAFRQRLDDALERAARRPGTVAVLFVDLDRFKVVNDSLGHAAGDRLLVEAAGRIERCLRPGDSAARLGGDEFTVLLEEVSDISDAARVADRMLAALQAPLSLDGHDLYISASIGIATRTTAMESTDDLIRHADLALYRAKDAGKGRFEIFDSALGARAVARLEMEADLRRALRDGELQLHYQPQVDLTAGRLVGMEALVRWQHPVQGLLSPDTFIPLAEETGLIVPLGRWVLEEACRQMGEWQHGAGGELLHMSVNVSPLQFRQAAFVGDVAAVLRSTGLPAQALTLELTESTLMQDAESSLATLTALKALGVELAIDDFGTGYSSLSYLRRYPIDVLKIDQSFVRGVDLDPEAAALVEGIVGLGHTLHLTMVAEGVETSGQMTMLQGLGCQVGQGYRFARPLTADAMTTMLRDASFGGAVRAVAAGDTAA